jgi:hypothetical protein
MKRHTRRCLLSGLLAVVASSADAQNVYKCTPNGRVVYSHEPCLGAQVVDTRPTQGLDKSSGQSRKGADVQKNEMNKAMAEALQPILGETPAEREKRHRRFKLPPSDRSECATLDAALLAQEAELRKTDKGGVPKAEAALFESRRQFRELRC